MIKNRTVYCDCCGMEKMGEIIGGKLIIKIRRHGYNHVATIELTEILDILNKRRNNQGSQAAKVAAEP